MEFSLRFCVMCLISLLVSQDVVSQDQPPKCVLEMMAKPGYMECLKGFTDFLQNEAGAGAGDPSNGGENTMKLLCTPEGRAAMQCMMKYAKDCPESMSQSGGMDFSAIMNEGGLEATCSLLQGPCMAVQQCIKPDAMNQTSGKTGGMMPPANTNPFVLFYQQSVSACGPMRAQYQCLMEHLADCKAEVEQFEMAMKNVIESGVGPDTALVSYDQFTSFMNNQCSQMPRNFSNNECIVRSLSGGMFAKCYQNATNVANAKNATECSLHDVTSSCIDSNVGKSCGKDNADFLKKTMNLAIKRVPVSCLMKDDPSAAGRNIQSLGATFLMLVVAFYNLM